MTRKKEEEKKKRILSYSLYTLFCSNLHPIMLDVIVSILHSFSQDYKKKIARRKEHN
jgi:hypothetical protein